MTKRTETETKTDATIADWAAYAAGMGASVHLFGQGKIAEGIVVAIIGWLAACVVLGIVQGIWAAITGRKAQ